jgi:hypothetical protein
VWEIEIEFVGRYVRTFGHEAHVAKRTSVHDGTKIIAGNAVELTAFAVVDQVKQAWEAIAEIEAATTPVTNIEDAPQFVIKLFTIVEVWVLPIDWMARWRVQAAFSAHATLSLESSDVSK